MANGKISGDPIATTAVGLNMAAIQGGANVQAPSTLFAANQYNLADLSNPGQALLNLGGLSSALAASTYLTQANAATTYQPLAANLTSWAAVTRVSGFDTFAATGVATILTGLPLTTGVTGTLAAANGGTGQASYAVGDIVYASGTTALSKLAKGTGYTFLRQNAAGTAPEWANALPGYDTNSFAGANESARLAALIASAPTNPFVYRSDSHIGIIRDTAPLNYQGTRAAFVLQRRDTGTGTTNELIPGAMFQHVSTGDGVVNSGSNLSQTIWMGTTSTMTKTGDGSGQCFTAIGELGVYGAGTYNELGLFQGQGTNTGSAHGTLSGVEMLLGDGTSGTHFDTTMHAVTGRIARFHSGTKGVANFFASSEGTVAPDAAFALNPAGFHTWARGIDLKDGTFTSGQAILLANNTSLASMNAAGTVTKPLIFLSASDEFWHTGATATSAIVFANSALAKSLQVLGVASSVNFVEVFGAVTTASPMAWANGSDTNIGLGHGTKGTGVHSFYTNGASLAKQLEIAHVASSVNYLQVNGAVTTAAPFLAAQGSDTNIGLGVATKGTGVISLFTNTTAKQVEISHIASAVNYITFAGSATGLSPVIGIGGTDTDRSMIFSGKGTGGITLRDGGGANKIATNTTGIGFFAATPVARGAVALPTGTIQRTTYDTATVTLAQLAGVVMAIITDDRLMGLRA